MRTEILQFLTMEDILNKYGIEVINKTFKCPFHDDKHPSAKMYDKNFYCFGCNHHGDLIQFVQDYFNLTFKEAMQKINQDFNLNLQSNTKLDYQKIKQLEFKRKQKEEYKKKLQKDFNNQCNLKSEYIKQALDLKKKLNVKNWEDVGSQIANIKDKIFIIDAKLDLIDNKLSSRH